MKENTQKTEFSKTTNKETQNTLTLMNFYGKVSNIF